MKRGPVTATKSVARTKDPKRAKALEWARTTEKLKGGIRCSTCSQKPEVVELIRDIARMVKIGESRVSIRQMLEMLRDEYGVTITDGAMQNHIRNCLCMNWSQRAK